MTFKGIDLFLMANNTFIPDFEYKSGGFTIQPADKLGLVSTLNSNLMNLGYCLSKDVFFALLNSNLSYECLKDYCSRIYNLYLDKCTLNGGVPAVFYKNFPDVVMEESNLALYFNAMLHYYTDGEYMPSNDNENTKVFSQLKKPLKNYIVIELANDDSDYIDYFKNLIASNIPITDQQLCYVYTYLSDVTDAFLESYFGNSVIYSDSYRNSYTNIIKDSLDKYIANKIPSKQTMCVVVSYFIKKMNEKDNEYADFYKEYSEHLLVKFVQTFTDFIRVCAYISHADYTLDNTKAFKSFSRKLRKLFLSHLEFIYSKHRNDLGEVLTRRNLWIALGEKLHPGEYKKYTFANEFFDTIRNNEKSIQTFNSKLDHLMSAKDYNAYLLLLSKRPGEFGRRLNYLFSSDIPNKDILSAFNSICSNLNTPMLISIYNYFDNRDLNKDKRLFRIKGRNGKYFVKDNDLTQISPLVCQYIKNKISLTLTERFNKLEELGNVYLDPSLKNYVIPFNMTSNSFSDKFIVSKGTSFDIDKNAKDVRPFIWWRNINDGETRTDVDLSATLYDKDFKKLIHISYTNLRSNHFGCCHSGDIVDAPNPYGASEYINFNMNTLRNTDVAYVVFQIYNYTGQYFSNMENCYFGCMEMDNVDSDIFEPTDALNKIHISAKSTSVIPAVLDVNNSKLIWVDMSCNTSYTAHNTEKAGSLLVETLKAVVNEHKLSLYDLFNLHCISRADNVYTDIGTIPENVEINTVFKARQTDTERVNMSETGRIITDQSFDIIQTEFLS